VVDPRSPDRESDDPVKTLVLISLLLTSAIAVADPPDARLDWWREARFGMFIHWGLYAVPAGEWNGRTDHAEWIRTTAQIPRDEYDRLRADFAAPNFDHPLTVAMFEATGDFDLEVSWEGPGLPKQPVPAAALSNAEDR